jgi:hypothetical protein
MRTSLFALVVLSSLLVSPSSRAASEPDPTSPVRGYFAALDRQDFNRAIALTDGNAQERTSRMVSELRQEAAQHHARVEVKVTRLAVRTPGAALPGRGVPVPVQFHIDVIGHKWFFNKVARVLEGDAQFFVDPARADRIVDIQGSLL